MSGFVDRRLEVPSAVSMRHGEEVPRMDLDKDTLLMLVIPALWEAEGQADHEVKSWRPTWPT